VHNANEEQARALAGKIEAKIQGLKEKDLLAVGATEGLMGKFSLDRSHRVLFESNLFSGQRDVWIEGPSGSLIVLPSLAQTNLFNQYEKKLKLFDSRLSDQLDLAVTQITAPKFNERSPKWLAKGLAKDLVVNPNGTATVRNRFGLKLTVSPSREFALDDRDYFRFSLRNEDADYFLIGVAGPNHLKIGLKTKGVVAGVNLDQTSLRIKPKASPYTGLEPDQQGRKLPELGYEMGRINLIPFLKHVGAYKAIGKLQKR
ncbi:MAG: hypothetical protein KDD53_09795, partial [Bdellovibrionales bacterium]|nr:hypothetical protein [Bdellovibrionales bacterium]